VSPLREKVRDWQCGKFLCQGHGGNRILSYFEVDIFAFAIHCFRALENLTSNYSSLLVKFMRFRDLDEIREMRRDLAEPGFKKGTMPRVRWYGVVHFISGMNPCFLLNGLLRDWEVDDVCEKKI